MNDLPHMKQFREYIARKIAAGAYASEDEAVVAIVRTLEAVDLQQTELRHLIEIGAAEADRDEFSPHTLKDIVRDAKSRAGLR